MSDQILHFKVDCDASGFYSGSQKPTSTTIAVLHFHLKIPTYLKNCERTTFSKCFLDMLLQPPSISKRNEGRIEQPSCVEFDPSTVLKTTTIMPAQNAPNHLGQCCHIMPSCNPLQNLYISPRLDQLINFAGFNGSTAFPTSNNHSVLFQGKLYFRIRISKQGLELWSLAFLISNLFGLLPFHFPFSG